MRYSNVSRKKGTLMRLWPCLAALLFCLPRPGNAEPGWIADSRSGCRVWNPDPGKNETITWSGDCKGGLAQGKGSLQWFHDGRLIESDEGTWRDGKRTGHEIMTWGNGNRFEGEYRDGLPDGHGVLTRPDFSYDGEWRDGKKTGHGIQTWTNGARYEGGWRDNRPDGNGRLTQANGRTYDGTWNNGCFKDGNRRAAIGLDVSACP